MVAILWEFDSLFAHQEFMSTQNINNLVELFFINYKKQKKDNILLTSLKDNRNYFTWEKTFHSIKKLSSEIKKYVNKGDRCLLISEIDLSGL